MNFTDLNCDKCGGYLTLIDDEELIYECKFCGYRKKINDNYKLKDYSTNGVVPIGNQIREKIKYGEYLLYKLREYGKAYLLFIELYKIAPNNVRVLEGIMVSMSYDFDFKKLKHKFKGFMTDFDFYYNRYKEAQRDFYKLNMFSEKCRNLVKDYHMYNLTITLIPGILFLIFYFYFIITNAF